MPNLLFISLIPAPISFGDCYAYSKTAHSFWDGDGFEIHDLAVTKYPPLYSIVISPAFAFEDMRLSYFMIKLINVILSSLIIFPIFFLSKKFLKEGHALMVSLLVGVFPAFFSFSGSIMAENLFYPLFVFALYFLYR